MVGVCGNEKDSDVLVTVDLNVTGIEVIIESKIKKMMFGKINGKNAVREVLSEMKVENAKVLVQDFGALDFVIKGRTRTAVRRAMAGKEVK